MSVESTVIIGGRKISIAADHIALPLATVVALCHLLGDVDDLLHKAALYQAPPGQIAEARRLIYRTRNDLEKAVCS